jgi:hypothetical protein
VVYAFGFGSHSPSPSVCCAKNMSAFSSELGGTHLPQSRTGSKTYASGVSTYLTASSTVGSTALSAAHVIHACFR